MSDDGEALRRRLGYLDWESNAEYLKCWRIVNGSTKSVLVPIDVLRRAVKEYPELQDELSQGTIRALQMMEGNQ